VVSSRRRYQLKGFCGRQGVPGARWCRLRTDMCHPRVCTPIRADRGTARNPGPRNPGRSTNRAAGHRSVSSNHVRTFPAGGNVGVGRLPPCARVDDACLQSGPVFANHLGENSQAIDAGRTGELRTGAYLLRAPAPSESTSYGHRNTAWGVSSPNRSLAGDRVRERAWVPSSARCRNPRCRNQ
jgi:hypothetical protein